MKKLLIIDDKRQEDGIHRIELLKKELNSRNVDFETTLHKVLKINESQDDLEWLIDINEYEYIFIHDSYNDNIFPSNIKEIMLSQVEDNKIIFFSGGSGNAHTARNESESAHYIVRRDVFYNNFNSFIEKSFQLNDYLSIDFFIKGKYEYAKCLKEDIQSLLEDSLEIALNSKEIQAVFILADYTNEYIEEKIQELLEQDEFSIIEFLEDIINTI